LDTKIESLRQSVFEVEQAQASRAREITRLIVSGTLLGISLVGAVLYLVSHWR
jgi:hypothetical protein